MRANAPGTEEVYNNAYDDAIAAGKGARAVFEGNRTDEMDKFMAGLSGDAADKANAMLQTALGAMYAETSSRDYAGYSIATQEEAQLALNAINDAIVKKDKVRAHLGGLQNRLENTVSNMTIQAENQEKSLLYTEKATVSDLDDMKFAALAALGRYLGFPAQAMVLVPRLHSIDASTNNLGNLPSAVQEDLKKYFDFDGQDQQKSHLTVGPDRLIQIDLANRLRSIPSGTRRYASGASCKIIERCPECGQSSICGHCGCGEKKTVFPGFGARVNSLRRGELIAKAPGLRLAQSAGAYKKADLTLAQ